MAKCTKAHAIKAALSFGFILIVFNVMSTRFDNKVKQTLLFSTQHASPQWPKRTPHNKMLQSPPAVFSSPRNISNNSLKKIYLAASTRKTSNIYTIHWNKNRTTLKNVTFNAPTVEDHHHRNSHLLVDSTDFKRKFPNHLSMFKKSSIVSTQNSAINLSDNDTSIFINALEFKNVINGISAYKVGNKNSSENFMTSPLTILNLNRCPLVPPNLEGPIEVNSSAESLQSIEHRLNTVLQSGGWYRPLECNPQDSVAIIVPFRDRHTHLPVFLKNLHPFLMKQQIHYGVFIVEQTNGKLFNRAALMNVGFIEASNIFKWDCFIFHDIDLLPLDDRNLYHCPDQPRHMSVAIDIFGYKLPYTSIFGGVSAMTTNQFKKVNGFSNSFWGWGGEDDDMSNRLKHANFHISRYPVNIARYMMLNHPKEKANPKRYENLANGAKKFDTDGINSVKYEIVNSRNLPLFTWLLVELDMPQHR